MCVTPNLYYFFSTDTLEKGINPTILPLVLRKIGLFKSSLATNLGEWSLWIPPGLTPLNNWLCTSFCTCKEFGYIYLSVGPESRWLKGYLTLWAALAKKKNIAESWLPTGQLDDLLIWRRGCNCCNFTNKTNTLSNYCWTFDSLSLSLSLSLSISLIAVVNKILWNKTWFLPSYGGVVLQYEGTTGTLKKFKEKKLDRSQTKKLRNVLNKS